MLQFFVGFMGVVLKIVVELLFGWCHLTRFICIKCGLKKIECLSFVKNSLLLNCSRFGSQVLDHRTIGFFVISDLCIMFSIVLDKVNLIVIIFKLSIFGTPKWLDFQAIVQFSMEHNVVYEKIIVLYIKLLQRFQYTCQ